MSTFRGETNAGFMQVGLSKEYKWTSSVLSQYRYQYRYIFPESRERANQMQVEQYELNRQKIHKIG